MLNYYCPGCDLLVASCSGKMEHFYAICSGCKTILHYDYKSNGLVDLSPQRITVENEQATYGWDRLKISDMFRTQKEAQKANHSHFFTGKPCRNGHIAPRTKRGECNQCVRDSAKRSIKKRKLSPKAKEKLKSKIRFLKNVQKS